VAHAPPSVSGHGPVPESGGNAGGAGGGGADGDGAAQQTFQTDPGLSEPTPGKVPSDFHSMTPSSGTTPCGPEVPQYFTPLTVR